MIHYVSCARFKSYQTLIKYNGYQAIILPDTPPDRINGIIVPPQARKPLNTGVIVSIKGNSVESDEGYLKDGDHVFFNYRSGYEVEYGGTKYLSINYNYLSGIIKDNTMKAIQNKILVEPIKFEQTKTEAGVILLEDKVTAEGVVKSTGRGKQDEPMEVTVGDTILYPKNAGFEVKGMRVITQSDVILITADAEIEND